MEKHLYLIDGHALVYRSYFAMMRTPLSSPTGQPTGAVFGVASILMSLIDKYKCPYLAVVFDSPVPTFRHAMYEKYKANREAMPDDLKSQMPLIFKLVEAFNLPYLKKDTFEADDILATLTRKAVEDGFEVSIVTKDKDLMQLIGPHVRMLAPESGANLVVMKEPEVLAKMGVGPEKIRDLLALTGDASDNIPGVSGVGPKTAVKILETAGSVDALLADTSCITNPKLREKIEQHRDALIVSQKLVSLDFNVDVQYSYDAMAARAFDKVACIALFKELGFKSLLNNPLFDASVEIKMDAVCIKNIDEVRILTEKIRTAGLCAIDTETTSTEPRKAKLVGISCALNGTSACYIPVGHTGDADRSRNLPVKDVLDILKDVLESPAIQKIGQNLKYDYQIFRNYGVVMKGISFDTMIAGYVVDPGKRAYSLDSLASEMLGTKTTPIESLIGTGKNQTTFDTVAIDAATLYASEDVVLPHRLMPLLVEKLVASGQKQLFDTVEMPLVAVLADMEWHGIRIDEGMLLHLSKEYHERLTAISQDIYAQAGSEFNLNSPQQIAEVLFTKLGLPHSKKTKTGYSTDVDALEKLAPEFPIARRILDYREIQKLLSTYIDALPASVHTASGRVHTSFNQTIAATGRLSSTNPNLQNIPIRTDDGRRIRNAFIPQNEMLLVSADYSQIELRVLAHVSDDSTLIDAFLNDKDIHAQTAAAMYGIFPEMVTPQQRRSAKTINFGLMYGMGPHNLAGQLGISFREAQDFIEMYFTQFPSIHAYMQKAIDAARTKGYAETLMGRRRFLPDMNADNRQVRESAERTAINTPIQGTAADIIKVAMININNTIAQKFPRATLMLQVHDELVFEVPRDVAPELSAWVCECMSSAITLKVPLKVEAGSGKSWGEAH